MIGYAKATVVGLIVLTHAMGLTSESSAEEILRYKDVIRYNSLPDTVKRSLPPTTPERARSAYISQLPSIVLDSATLIVDPPQVGSSFQSLTVASLQLRNGAKIVTDGNDFE